MQDKETDSYWSIMKGESVGGQFKGTELRELPVTQKVRWADWVALHPDTVILSLNGREDVERNPYDAYFESEEGFRGSEASDDRLSTKQEIYAFRVNGKAFAAPFFAIEGGEAFQVDGRTLFLFRAEESPLYESTVAFLSDAGGFERVDGKWTHTPSGRVFDEKARAFLDGEGNIQPLAGFDTYWYTWSPFHPDTEILE